MTLVSTQNHKIIFSYIIQFFVVYDKKNKIGEWIISREIYSVKFDEHCNQCFKY